MNGGFSNPIVGGDGALVYPAIYSPDFVHDLSGWKIAKDGSAEFNNLTIRGTFFGADFIINSSGIFIYSGTPALGNLTGSWAPASGNDQFGNPYPSGAVIYGTNGSYINLSSTGGFDGNLSLLFNPPSAIHVSTLNQLTGRSINAGLNTEQEQVTLSSGKAGAGLDDMALQLFSESHDGTVPAQWVLEAGGQSLLSGTRLLITSLVSMNVTTGTPATPTLITTDTFHPVTLDANWSTLGGQPVPSYQLTADGMVHLTGAIQFNVNINSTNINGGNPLPAAYRPATEIFIAGAPGSAGVAIQANGVLVAAQAPGQTTVFCNFNGRYPRNL